MKVWCVFYENLDSGPDGGPELVAIYDNQEAAEAHNESIFEKQKGTKHWWGNVGTDEATRKQYVEAFEVFEVLSEFKG